MVDSWQGAPASVIITSRALGAQVRQVKHMMREASLATQAGVYARDGTRSDQAVPGLSRSRCNTQ